MGHVIKSPGDTESTSKDRNVPSDSMAVSCLLFALLDLLPCLLVRSFVFETGFQSVEQTGLELPETHLPLPPKCGD